MVARNLKTRRRIYGFHAKAGCGIASLAGSLHFAVGQRFRVPGCAVAGFSSMRFTNGTPFTFALRELGFCHCCGGHRACEADAALHASINDSN